MKYRAFFFFFLFRFKLQVKRIFWNKVGVLTWHPLIEYHINHISNKLVQLVVWCDMMNWSTYISGTVCKILFHTFRWHNHLNPSINKNAWTIEEEVALVRAHQVYGNKWAELSKYLPGRFVSLSLYIDIPSNANCVSVSMDVSFSSCLPLSSILAHGLHIFIFKLKSS